MKYRLVELSQNEEHDILDLLKSFDEVENGFHSPGLGFDVSNFEEFLNRSVKESKGIDLAPGYVPQTIFWLYVDDKPVGVGKLRSYLNESLRLRGGHIGYAIRESERGKGYGNKILEMLLMKALEKAINPVLITCNSSNVRSRRVIEVNGGKLESELNDTCKYWFNLKEWREGLKEMR